MALKALEAIRSKERNSCIDVYRALAIISVVLFHFQGFLPHGEVGVDLFFVISGFLVGGILTKQYKKGERIVFGKFFLQRGLKIWPSYYAFLLVGSLLAWMLYRKTAPNQLISFSEIGRYIFFYQNFKGFPLHYSFDQVWSLCIEEHFYIVLPIGLIILQSFRFQKKALFTGALITIILGILFKLFAYYFTHSQETYAGTQNRIDALAWGFLLNLLFTYFPEMNTPSRSIWIFLTGVLLMATLILIETRTNSIIYHKVIFHSLAPVAYFIMLLGSYKFNFSNWKVLRLIAYYSYNWYLWHTIFVYLIISKIGFNFIGLLTYLIISFFTAMLFTMLIEEPILNKRSYLIRKIFHKKPQPLALVSNEAGC